MCEMTPSAAYFPDAIVGTLPGVLHKDDQVLHYLPAEFRGSLHAHLARGVNRGHGLAVDIELELAGGRVAGSYRFRTFVPGEPAEFELGQAPPAEYVVHDLQIGRISCDCTQHPVTKLMGFLYVSSDHQRFQSETGVTQPAKPIIPIAHASEFLGQ